MVRVERDLILTVLRLMVRLIFMRWVEMSLRFRFFINIYFSRSRFATARTSPGLTVMVLRALRGET